MESSRHCFLLAICLFSVHQVLCSIGPVFINPESSGVANVVSSTNQGNFVTQTVYGFLDFTTTIGNTVMVFSPQSAAQESLVTEKKDIASNTVIETRPNVVKEIAIAPSKPQVVKERTEQVSVKQESPSVSLNVIPLTSKKVVHEPSSIVNVVSAPILSSIVEVVEGPSTITGPPKVTSKAPVTVTNQPHITSHAPTTITSDPIITTALEIVTQVTTTDILPTQVTTTKVDIGTTATKILSSIVEVKSNDEPAVIIGNNIAEPEYDFLSRQPSEVVEETYKVINLKPSSKFHLKPRASDAKNKPATKRGDSAHPTGLVTKLGGTVIKDGTTTVHETSVIGTYISGKYAQVLQSTSHVYNNQKGQIKPSPSLRILKTAAPQLGKNKNHRHLEPTPAGSVNEETSLPVEQLFNGQNIKATRKPGGSSKPRFKNRSKETSEENVEEPPATPPQKKSKNRPRASK